MQQVTSNKDQILDKNMKNVKNSDVFKHTIISLVYVARSKTSDDYAWSSIKKLLSELTKKYKFLSFIKIPNINYLNYNMDDIIIDENIDQVDSLNAGQAIQDIIDLLKKYLGKKAGYFFIQEFKSILGEKYYSVICKMGVDLRLVELQKDFSGLDTSVFKIKDSGNSNIAFVEKVN